MCGILGFSQRRRDAIVKEGIYSKEFIHLMRFLRLCIEHSGMKYGVLF